MKKIIMALVAALFLAASQTAYSGGVRTLAWKDLIPYDLSVEDPFKGMGEELLATAAWAVELFENLPERNDDTEELFQMADEAVAELKEAGIDIKALMAKRKLLRTSVVSELNGRKIAIGGYLLPLEMDGSKVTEFLLVPYVGACIHSPPPPPNQILHVTVKGKKGYKSEALFDPVLVTGVMSVKSATKDLFLADGSMDLNIGYAMQASTIKPYKD